MERHPGIRFCAHYSGPLLEWIQRNHLEFFEKLRDLIGKGRLELLGGGFYEPVFPMLPERDLFGQIDMMQEYLLKNFGARATGAWIPERVWEPHLAGRLARAGVEYAVLDDFHFEAAGVRDEDLRGRFLTEDAGDLISIFPGRERLRYTIPFEDPKATIDYLAERAGSVVVFADDGEKFGCWPTTRKHCWDEGWVDRFLELLESDDRIRTGTFRDAMERPAAGKVYLPACSYREMGEWSSLGDGQTGGIWRNFRVKYPESNLMYGRMMDVSDRVGEAGSETARRELYRAQCNCAYWHGVFGGLYLTHLRAAVYRHLILAENALGPSGFGTRSVDLDLDGRDEICLYNESLNLFVRPHGGGHLQELDVRSRELNLAATLARRRESYHAKIAGMRTREDGGAKSIHEIGKTKGAEIEGELRYDPYDREGFIDHFLAPGRGPDVIETGEGECGDFAWGEYAAEIRRVENRVHVALTRRGRLELPGQGGRKIRVGKEYILPKEGAEFQVAYSISNEDSRPARFRFAVEMQLAMCGPDLLGATTEFPGPSLRLEDDRHDMVIEYLTSSGSGFWSFPIRTVSQSEDGFELNYQGSVIAPYWDLSLDPGGTWGGVITHRITLQD